MLLLGDRTLEDSGESLAAGQARAFRFPAEASGAVSKLNVYVDVDSSAGSLDVALFADNADHPGALIASGSDGSPTAGEWNSIALTGGDLQAGTDYWLAILPRGGTLHYRDRAHGSCLSDASAKSGLSAMPSAWKMALEHGSCPLSAYVTGIGQPNSHAPRKPSETESLPGGPPEPVELPTSTAPDDIVAPAVTGTAVQGNTLSASTGTWSGSPTSYAYEWQDCSSSGKSCTGISGARGSHYVLASSDVGHELRVVVTASNSVGSTSADSAMTAQVGAAPTAPVNIGLPTISGSAEERSVLTASAGSWSGSPTSTHYQWLTCSHAGGSCADIAGASAHTLTLTSAEVGDKVRVAVTASNSAGSASATSAATAVVVVDPSGEGGGGGSGGGGSESGGGGGSESGGGGGSESGGGGSAGGSESGGGGGSEGRLTSCIDNLLTCGFPDPSSTNVGPGVACSSLTPANGMIISQAGTTVQDMNITGSVAIDASNVTLTHDCITSDGGGQAGSAAVIVEQRGTNAQIDYSDVSGANSSTGSVEEAIRTNYPNMNTVADHDYIYNCGECFHGAGTLTNDYVTSNASINPGQSDEDHYEGIYYGGGGGPLVVEHDTIVDPHYQTAAIFVSHDFGNVTTLTITDNILEGGDYTIYGGGSGSAGTVVGPVTVTGNRFGTENFPNSAQYGPGYYFDEGVTTWSGNIWDATLATVPFPG